MNTSHSNTPDQKEPGHGHSFSTPQINDLSIGGLNSKTLQVSDHHLASHSTIPTGEDDNHSFQLNSLLQKRKSMGDLSKLR